MAADKKLSRTGTLIMFDGPDWVGKTTQIGLAAEALRSQGRDVYTTRINGGTPIGEAIRHIYMDAGLSRPRKTDLHLMLAGYYALAADLEARRQASPDTIYLVDRSPLSMYAYHASGGGLMAEGNAATEESLRLFAPDLIIYYTAPPAVLQAHRRQRETKVEGRPDFVESQPPEYMQRVIDGYQTAAKRYRAHTIDASGSVEAVHQSTMSALRAVLH